MSYKIILLPLLALGLSQTIKFFLETNKLKPSINNLFAYSGMPSGHSAMVASLATAAGLEYGLASPYFAISLVLAIIIIRDAVGLRRYLGQHGKVLNKLVGDLDEDHMLDRHYPHLLEKIGHTPAQVIAGVLIGILVSSIGFMLD
jgi:uncharacterized protein